MLQTSFTVSQTCRRTLASCNLNARSIYHRYTTTNRSCHTPHRNFSVTATRWTTFQLSTSTSQIHPRKPYPRPRVMSTSAPSDPAIDEVLHFWFEELQFDDWFRGSSKHDATITSRFADLVEKARTTDKLDETWLSTPSGSLAMVILLDQFTRNIFRAGNHAQPGLSFSGDTKALRIASQSFAKGFDRQIEEEKAHTSHAGKTYRYFFTLPFQHAEDLPSQVAAVSLTETMAAECELLKLQKELQGKQETESEKFLREWLVTMSIPIAVLHMKCVAKLGRFPKRNEPLGRETTEAERKFLEEHPNGF